MAMIKVSKLPDVKVFKSYKEMFKNVADNLKKIHAVQSQKHFSKYKKRI